MWCMIILRTICFRSKQLVKSRTRQYNMKTLQNSNLYDKMLSSNMQRLCSQCIRAPWVMWLKLKTLEPCVVMLAYFHGFIYVVIVCYIRFETSHTLVAMYIAARTEIICYFYGQEICQLHYIVADCIVAFSFIVNWFQKPMTHIYFESLFSWECFVKMFC